MSKNEIFIEWTLLVGKMQGVLTAEEEEKFRCWYDADPSHKSYYDRMVKVWEGDKVYHTDTERLIREFRRFASSYRRIQRRKRIVKVVAATIAAVVGLTAVVSLYTYYNEHSQQNNGQMLAAAEMIVPGRSQAILQMPDGTSIEAEKISEGQVIKAAGISIVKEDSHIRYEEIISRDSIPRYHTVIVPRCGEYNLILPDGTEVWLNSQTVLNFPLNFSASDDRRVALSGEAFFKVAHDPKRPFVVETDMGEVRAYGTSLNVEAYDDQTYIRATLISGSMGYRAPGRTGGEVLLSPGQQVCYAGRGMLEITEVKTENVIDWKSGYFNFESERLEDIMMRLSRWYFINVVFEDDELRNMLFTGKINRHDNFIPFVELFEATSQISFDIRGRVVTIRKKAY